MATRQRSALARLQLVLDLSMWNMLNNGVCVLDFDNEDCHDGMDNSLYVEGECMVCSNMYEYPQVQPVGISEFERDDENLVEAESLLSVSQGWCCGNFGDVDDVSCDTLWMFNFTRSLLSFGLLRTRVCYLL